MPRTRTRPPWAWLSCLLLLVGALAMIACSSPAGEGRSDAGSGEPPDEEIIDASPAGFRVLFVDPPNGPFTGGTELTVRGNGFDEDVEVYIGGRLVEPNDQQVVDSRRILVRTPPGDPGLAEVEVRRPFEVASLADAFRYEPIVVDPPLGSVTGGTFVTITGFETDFQNLTQVLFDGAPLTDLQVVNQSVLTGITPPGISGSADVTVSTTGGDYQAQRAYTYLATADPFAGGMGGGSINGDLNVVVIDAITKNGVDGAYVSIGDPQSSELQGNADDLGQISFSAPGLAGPITTIAAAPGYETASFVSYDARDITIMLRAIPPDVPPEPPGPPPPAPRSGHILGHIVFGDATGLGSPVWNLVPEPRNPDEIKRIYVTTAARTLFSRPFGGVVIDYEGFDPNKTAWEFDILARPSATAVVAMAGLYNQVTEGFEPFAMGVTRGVLVGPGEFVMGLDVVVNIPLDTALLVELDDPPALDTPGWDGPVEYTIRPFIDLGGEGAIIMNGHGQPASASNPVPGTYRFDEGSRTILMPSMAPLTGTLADASYSFIAGAYSENGSTPFSVRIERGVNNVAVPLSIGDFLGVPRAVDPAPESTATGFAFEIEPEGPASGDASFHMHNFIDEEATLLLRTFARGDEFRVDVPDLRGKGVPVFPTDRDVNWTHYSIRIPGVDFDEFNYRQLRINSWSAYAADSQWVHFPEPAP